jgi:glycosyltransferase involved in cell wall biosynthesis
LFISFALILLVGLANGADRGYLSSKLMFGSLAVINFIDPVIRLSTAVFLVYFDFQYWTFTGIPLAIFFTFLVGWFLIVKNKPVIKDIKEKVQQKKQYKFPFHFFTASLFNGFASIIFTSIDIILANHFFSAKEAGIYALLTLVGKMIYFMGGLTTPFIMPLISRNEGANKDSRQTFRIIVTCTSALAFIGFISLGIFGRFTVPLLYGEKALSILPFLLYYTFGMTCFTVSKVFVNYYLAKKVYTVTVVACLLGVLQFVLLLTHHQNAQEFSIVMSEVLTIHLICMLVLHFSAGHIKSLENNVIDFLGLFGKKEVSESHQPSILIFNWRDIYHKWAGGAEVYIHELAKQWAKQSINVTIFSAHEGKSSREQVVDGVNIIRRGGFYTVYIWAFFYYIFRFRNKFDFIIDSENGIPFFTPFYARTKIYLLVHHVHQEIFRKSLPRPLAAFASFLELKMMPLVYKNKPLITVSNSTKDEILKHKLTTTSPHIIYNGVDPDIFYPGKKSKRPMVLYLGRLQYYKSLNVLLRSAKEVLKSIPDAEFIIAGNGEERNKLEKYAKKLGIDQNVTFMGKVTEKEKVELYQKAWVFVNTSFMEGWGITTIEANACGTPVVASNVHGLRDSVVDKRTGYLVKYGDYEAFAQKIALLLNDKQKLVTLSEQALAWSSNFRWEKSAAQFYNLMMDDLSSEKKVVLKKALFNYR